MTYWMVFKLISELLFYFSSTFLISVVFSLILPICCKIKKLSKIPDTITYWIYPILFLSIFHWINKVLRLSEKISACNKRRIPIQFYFYRHGASRQTWSNLSFIIQPSPHVWVEATINRRVKVQTAHAGFVYMEYNIPQLLGTNNIISYLRNGQSFTSLNHFKRRRLEARIRRKINPVFCSFRACIRQIMMEWKCHYQANDNLHGCC